MPRILYRAAALAALALAAAAPAQAQSLEGPLVVYNAGSLAVPFQRLLAAFAERHPGVRVSQEHSGSLAAARKLTEFDRIPDVIALADRTIFPRLLQPSHVDWYAVFAGNAMVLAASPTLAPDAITTSDAWPETLLDPDVRWGHADPEIDPAGYRTFLVFDLAESYRGEPGLSRRLRERSEARFVRPKSADLVALLQVGELDYAWLYASTAKYHGLPVVTLPDAINLASPAQAGGYGTVSVSVPGRSRRPEDRVEIRGSPIAYALSVPRGAPNREAGEAFVRFVLSDAGRAILDETGFRTFDAPEVVGAAPEGLP